MMWEKTVVGECAATSDQVFAILADTSGWSTWNSGVADVRRRGAFEAGAEAVKVFPDGTELPFRLGWVETGRGFEDVTEVPDAGVTVHVAHELEAWGAVCRITYRCRVEGPADAAAAVGEGASADFPEVIRELGARAEQLGG